MYAMESIRRSLGLEAGRGEEPLGEMKPMLGRKLKILVVDDEDAMREVLQMRLEQWGYQVRLAEDGTEGEKVAASFQPDIVISDVIMPRISGIDLLRLCSITAGSQAIMVDASGDEIVIVLPETV